MVLWNIKIRLYLYFYAQHLQWKSSQGLARFLYIFSSEIRKLTPTVASFWPNSLVILPSVPNVPDVINFSLRMPRFTFILRIPRLKLLLYRSDLPCSTLFYEITALTNTLLFSRVCFGFCCRQL